MKRRKRADANAAALPPPADERVSVIAPTPPDRAANDNHLPDEGAVPASTLHEIVLEAKRSDRDPFCAAVLRHMGDDLLGDLKPKQREALERALYACRPLQRHPVDVRGVIPIFFWRFYYVILMGRDRRVATDALEADRRRKANFIADVILFTVLAVQALIVVAVVLYLVKSALGIDLIRNHHASEILD